MTSSLVTSRVLGGDVVLAESLHAHLQTLDLDVVLPQIGRKIHPRRRLKERKFCISRGVKTLKLHRRKLRWSTGAKNKDPAGEWQSGSVKRGVHRAGVRPETRLAPLLFCEENKTDKQTSSAMDACTANIADLLGSRRKQGSSPIMLGRGCPL